MKIPVGIESKLSDLSLLLKPITGRYGRGIRQLKVQAIDS